MHISIAEMKREEKKKEEGWGRKEEQGRQKMLSLGHTPACPELLSHNISQTPHTAPGARYYWFLNLKNFQVRMRKK